MNHLFLTPESPTPPIRANEWGLKHPPLSRRYPPLNESSSHRDSLSDLAPGGSRKGYVSPSPPASPNSTAIGQLHHPKRSRISSLRMSGPLSEQGHVWDSPDRPHVIVPSQLRPPLRISIDRSDSPFTDARAIKETVGDEGDKSSDLWDRRVTSYRYLHRTYGT